MVLREKICEKLNISIANLPFIAELIEVTPKERAWQGAIERALGAHKLVLLTDKQHYSAINHWMNQRHLGCRLQVRAITGTNRSVKFFEDGYLRKLNWKQHPYREFLKHYLARHDLHCVDTIDRFNTLEYAITQQGLIQRSKGHSDKDDRFNINDQRRWYLGFSNKQRLANLKQEFRTLSEQHQQLEKQQLSLHDSLMKNKNLNEALKIVETIQWHEIDLDSINDRISSLRQQLEDLHDPNSKMAQAEVQWKQAKKALGELSGKRRKLDEKLTLRKDKINTNQQRIDETQAQAKKIPAEIVSLLDNRVTPLELKDLENRSLTDTYQADIRNEQNKTQEDLKKNTLEAQRKITSFYQKWPELAVDWGESTTAIDEYIEHYQRIMEEGLPELEARFREKLNNQTVQSLIGLQSQIVEEHAQIEERIDTINEVLRKTDYRVDTYLKIVTRRENHSDTIELKDKLVRVCGSLNSDDHERRFKDLKTVIELLKDATHPVTSKNIKSLRQLDPRYQRDFSAEEILRKDNSICQVYKNSLGKSGGEKESFSSVILAASLAYVLTPDGSDKPIYCSVFLDEAFSQASESVSRRVLAVFKELNIHLNLITPFKNLNLARQVADSVLIVRKDKDQHDSSLSEVTWQVAEEKFKARYGYGFDEPAPTAPIN